MRSEPYNHHASSIPGLTRFGGHSRCAVVVLAAMLGLVACAGGTAAPPGGSGQPFEIAVRDTSWEGRVYGLVGAGPASADRPGCVAVIGEIRPTSLPGVVSSGLRVPRIGLSAGKAKLVEAVPGNCDVGDLEAAGYGSIRDARVTVGTAYLFYRVFHLPAGGAAPRSVVGSVSDPFDASDRVAESFEPRLLDALPYPERRSAVPITAHHVLLPAGALFAYPDGATPWEGAILGLIDSQQIPVPPPVAGGAAARAGRCVLILGWLRTGRATAEGSFVTPTVGLIADGRLMGSGGRLERCDATEPTFAGFGRLRELLNPASGDAYPFYQQVFIPETIRGVPEAIIVRYPWSRDQWFLFKPTVLSDLPDSGTGLSAGSWSAVLVPAGDPDLSTFHNGSSFSQSGQYDSRPTISSVEWQGAIHGLAPVPTSPELSGTHRCLAVIGTLSVTRFEGFDLTAPPLRPDLGLMIAGQRINPSSPQDCDTSRLRRLGYIWFETTGATLGSSDSFYETFTLTHGQADDIQAIVAGSVWFSTFRFFEPTTLHTIPAA